MVDFEDAGRRLDKELEKLRQFLKTELKPTTERKTAEALRRASERLAELAERIEARLAGKSK